MLPHANPLLLSIAIPTKNRQSYLINLVDELVTSSRRDFEVVVQDNSDDQRLAAYVAGLKDSRVRYYYIGEWISVVDNCDAAVRACTGEYICMLGDDDGILLDEALDELSDARQKGVDAVTSPILLYTWPDSGHHSIKGLAGKLYRRPLRSYKRGADPLRQARRVVARSGAMGPEGLPCVYHGFIARSVLEQVNTRTGSNFPGPSPDMANAVAISSFIRDCRYADRPLVISGHSRSSGGGRGAMREHRGSIAEQQHLPKDTAEKWYGHIPFFWSAPTIYAQSLLSALDRTQVDTLGTSRSACLYAACFLFEPAFAGETWRAMRKAPESMWRLLPQIAYHAVNITAKRAVQFANNMQVRFSFRRASFEAKSMADAIRTVRTRFS